MKFQYYENDAMDEIPAPPLKMILSLLGCTTLFACTIILCAKALGG